MNVSRRSFLSRGSIGVALVGAAAVIPGLRTIVKLGTPPAAGPIVRFAGSGQLVAHVRDVTTGEISLMAGTTKVMIHDADLAARLYTAARVTPSKGR